MRYFELTFRIMQCGMFSFDSDWKFQTLARSWSKLNKEMDEINQIIHGLRLGKKEGEREREVTSLYEWGMDEMPYFWKVFELFKKAFHCFCAHTFIKLHNFYELTTFHAPSVSAHSTIWFPLCYIIPFFRSKYVTSKIVRM